MELPDIWTRFAMGGISLFPLFGEITKLRDFFPSRYRRLHVVMSTVFSLVIFFVVHWHFRALRPYVPLLVSFLLAAVFFGAYVIVFFTLKSRFSKAGGLRLAMMLMATLVSYVSFVASLTYTFNVLERSRDFKVYYGIVTRGDTGEVVPGATVTFDASSTQTTRRSGAFGYYSQILSNDEAQQLTGIKVEWIDAQGKFFGAALTAAQLRSDGYERIDLTPFG